MPAQAADLLFQAEAQSLSGVCDGGAVRLEGNHDTVALSGPCQSLLLKGVGNTITLTMRQGGTIHIEGSGNHVTYASSGAAPRVEILGPDNEVAAGTSASPTPPSERQVAPGQAVLPHPAPPPPALVKLPASLALGGDDHTEAGDCAGRDAAVGGSRSAYVLRGTCRSLSVTGDLLTVQAEVAPGARIAVTGRGIVVSWTVHGRGAPPVVTVRGAGSRVQQAQPAGQ